MKNLLFAGLLLLLPVLANAQSLKLTWQDNSTNEIGFAIERCQGAGCTGFAEITRTGANVTEALDATVAEGATYCYRVRAFSNDALGKEQFSAYTNTACATTKSPEPEPIPIPDAPSGLEVLEIQATSLDLRWQGDSDAVVSQVEINDHPQGRPERFRLLSTLPSDLRQWKVAGLSRNSVYYFRLRNCAAVDSLCSDYSNVAGVKTPR